MFVTVCGRNIHNYRPQEAITRDGWLHFSVLAKGADLRSTIELCRNWSEFWEWRVLAMLNFFPNKQWACFPTTKGVNRSEGCDLRLLLYIV